ncbi:MAG TPA: hypothetical protein DDX75_02795 [Phycisphaerales bacterium]|nr:hypothetical protein [Phycisphaerales bacterium]
MAKEKIFYVLAGGLILTLANVSFAFDGYWNWYFHHPRFRPQTGSAAYLQRTPLITEEKTITISIVNDNGSITEVTLIASDNGYIGPKGEYYSTMPTESQLKSIYGLICAPPIRNNIIFYLGKCNGIEKIVVLNKDGAQYLGPKGERYDAIPSEEQLRSIYCK